MWEWILSCSKVQSFHRLQRIRELSDDNNISVTMLTTALINTANRLVGKRVGGRKRQAQLGRGEEVRAGDEVGGWKPLSFNPSLEIA